MFQAKEDRCSDSRMTGLLEDLIRGSLSLPEREQDRHRFADHIRTCQPCRAALIEYANEKEALPALQDLAGKYQMKIGPFAKRVLETVRVAVLSGRARRVFVLVDDSSGEGPRMQPTAAGLANSSDHPDVDNSDKPIDAVAADDDSEPLGLRRRA